MPVRYRYFFSTWHWLLLALVSYGCNQPYQYEDAYYRVQQIGQMPKVVKEGSGLAFIDSTAFWTLNDGGGLTELYRVSKQGQWQATLSFSGIRNVDWEELARDAQGNLYIGDFGNNWSMRRDLCIYRVKPSEPKRIEKTHFSFSDQHEFPPLVNPRNFDCEAFFWYRDSLYLFSKNWNPAPEKMYVVPAPTSHLSVVSVAELKEETLLNPKQHRQGKRTLVTAADLSPDGKLLALLAYGEVYLFAILDGKITLKHPYHHLFFGENAVRQVESLVFINNTDFIFTNEQRDIFLAQQKSRLSTR